MSQNLQISKGEVIVLTSGEYSSYGICGYCIALKDFDMAKAAQSFGNGKSMFDLEMGEFQAHLIIKELVMPVEYRSIYLGDDYLFDEEFGVKEKKYKAPKELKTVKPITHPDYFAEAELKHWTDSDGNKHASTIDNGDLWKLKPEQ